MCATITVSREGRGSPDALREEGSLDHDRDAERGRFMSAVRAHDQGLRALAYRLLGDRDEMDDVLQEAYLRAYRNLAGFRGDASLGTWLYRITYNACMDRLRAAQRDRHVYLEDLGGGPQEPRSANDISGTSEQRTELARALASLPPDQRAAVLLVDAQGYDYATTADILGIAEGTLASRLHSARATLRRTLDPDMRPSTARREGR